MKSNEKVSISLQTRFTRNLDWNLLRVFHVIVQAGSITRAASLLGRQQPAVSLALRRLEGHLGVSLCTRSPNHFELTPEGVLIAKSCEEIFGKIRDLPSQLVNLPGEVVGSLRIVAVSSITSKALDEAITTFHRQCPRVQIGVDIVPWEEVARQLRRQKADIGIAPARFIESGFHYCLLDSEPIGIYCGRSHSLYGRKFNRPEDLSDTGVILTGGDEPDIISKYRLEHGLDRIVAGQSDFLDEAKRLTVQGVGICFLPEPFVLQELKSGELWSLLTPSQLFASDIYLISMPGNQAQLTAKLFLSVVQSKSSIQECET